jgi:hypothetical protein
VNPCTHHHPADALAAYAADALDDPGERRAVEGHLAHCPGCRDRLVAHERVLARLVGDEAPPAALWDGIAARVARSPAAGGTISGVRLARLPGADPPAAGSLGGAPLSSGAPSGAGSPAGAGSATVPCGTDAARPLRVVGSARPSAAPPGPCHRGGERRRPRRLGLAAAAAALVAAAAAAPLAVAAWQRPAGPAGVPMAAARTAAVLDDATGRPMARMVERDGATYLVLDGLPPLPADRTYQLWSLDGPRPASLGVVGRGAARTVPVLLPAGTRRVAISDEPAGGSPEPTSAIAGSGRLV